MRLSEKRPGAGAACVVRLSGAGWLSIVALAAAVLSAPSAAHACTTGHIDVFTQADSAALVAIVRGRLDGVDVLTALRGDPAMPLHLQLDAPVAAPAAGRAQRPRTRRRRVIMLDLCASHAEPGRRYLMFTNAAGGFLNVLNESLVELPETGAGAATPEPDGLVDAVQRWLRAADPAARRALLLSLAARSGAARADAALHLAVDSAQLASVTAAERRALASTLDESAPVDVLWLLARLHAPEAVAPLLARIERAISLGNRGREDEARLFLEVLTNHREPRPGPGDDGGRRVLSAWRAWTAAGRARGGPLAMVSAGFAERGLTLRDPADRTALAGIVRAAADPIARLVALDLCARAGAAELSIDGRFVGYLRGASPEGLDFGVEWAELAEQCAP